MGQRTEEAEARYRGLDQWPGEQILAAILSVQIQAVGATEAVLGPLAEAAEAIAERLRGGGRLVYAGAGSSGLMGLVDGLELPGTYGLSRDSVVILVAGGAGALSNLPADIEDDESAGRRDIDDAGVNARDALIALSASGATPYTLAALRRAAGRGALTVALADNADAPLLREADHPILLATPPDVIAGSTRMGAGTAQKCALNMLSTLVGIRLGHVYDGQMVNLRADNAKLRHRAAAMVARIARCSPETARATLEAADGEVKTAIEMLATGADAHEARAQLRRHKGHLRAALAAANKFQ